MPIGCNGYLCFPPSSIPSIAEKLNFKKASAWHASAVTWSDIYVNRRVLKNYLLDSGSDSTVLLKKEISLLNLKKLDTEILSITSRGTEPRALYDFAEVGWPHLHTTQRLIITETPNDRSRVLGMDFLRHYIISLDLGANYFYIGE